MQSKIVVQKLKKGAVVSEGDYASINAHPLPDMSGFLEAIALGLAAYFTGNEKLAGAAAAKAYDAAKSVFEGSDKSYGAQEGIAATQSDEYDQIAVIYKAWSEDTLKGYTQKTIFAPGEAEKYFEEVKEKSYVVGYVLNTSNLFTGTYPFIFGAQDEGTFTDVAVLNRLDLNFQAVQPKGWTKVPGGGDYWQDWSKVSGGGNITDVSLACASFNDCLYLFGKGIDDKHIYVNSMKKDLSWTGWKEVYGDGVTDVALASVSFKGILYLFGKGIDDKGVYVNKTNDGENWMGWSGEIGGTTDVGLCAIVAFGKLFLFGKGIDDKRIYVNRTADGQAWEGWREVPGNGTTDVSLGGAFLNISHTLYLFRKGIDDKGVYVNIIEDGENWTGWSGEIGGTTDVALAACECRMPEGMVPFGLEIFGNGIEDKKIYQNELNTNINQLGVTTTGWKELGGTTDVALACVNFHNKVWLFAKGIEDKQIYVNINP